MAYELPTVPDNKVWFYRDRLIREVSNLFKWENMPDEIPLDYLEKTLITSGRAMFFNDSKTYGYMALECVITGYNVYKQPTMARAVAPNDQNLPFNFERNIIHKYDDKIGIDNSSVLINNMYHGESLRKIIDHYAYRMALIQQAFDTNAIWQNMPVLFTVDDPTVKLSLEKMFSDILDGRPWVIVDRQLLGKDNGTQSDPITIPFILDQLMDAKNEIYNEFKATIGIDNIAVDKKERLIVGEVESNKQSTDTCLEIMLSQRRIACEEINKVFGLDVSVEVNGQSNGEVYGEGVEEFGSGDNRVEESADNEGL